jgi:hypothetical protein
VLAGVILHLVVPFRWPNGRSLALFCQLFNSYTVAIYSISTATRLSYKILMKKAKLEKREAAMHVRVRPSVKATAERLAQEDDRSLAHWLERLIEAEAARQDGKK